DAGDECLVERIVHEHLVGVDGACARPLADAERIEGRERVRTELDAGADFAEPGALLEDLDREAPTRQREGCREPADATAGDDDRKGICRIAHPGLLWSALSSVYGRPSTA